MSLIELFGYIVDVALDMLTGAEFIADQNYCWGWITIGISWIPGLVALAAAIENKVIIVNVLITVLKLLLWPAYVPFYR